MNILNLLEKKLYSKLSKKQILRRVAESLCVFLRTHDEAKKYVEIIQSNSSDKYVHHFNIEIWNLSDPGLQLIKNKPMIKNKLKELFSELKKFKVKKILFLQHKKRNDCKIFHSSVKLIACDSEIDEVSMHQYIITKMKNYACEDWIVVDLIIKHSINIFAC